MARLVAACAMLTGCGAGGAVTTPAGRQAAAVVRAIDPCTLLTDAELRSLLTEPPARRAPGGRSGSTCTVPGASGRLAVRVVIVGSPDTAAAVYRDRLAFGEPPQQVRGVGRAAFAVIRPDEAGLVTLTRTAVLSVSLVTMQGVLTWREQALARLTPVVRQAAARI